MLAGRDHEGGQRAFLVRQQGLEPPFRRAADMAGRPRQVGAHRQQLGPPALGHALDEPGEDVHREVEA